MVLPYPADEDEVTFEILAQVQRQEKNRGQLSEIKPNFYRKTKEYLDRLRTEISAEASSNPTSPKLVMMKDELARAERDFKRIYDYRQRKILLLANSQSSGSRSKIENILKEEKKLFGQIVELLDNNKANMFSGGGDAAREPISEPELVPEPKEAEIEEDEKQEYNESDTDSEELGKSSRRQPKKIDEEEAAAPIETYEDVEPTKPYSLMVVKILEDVPAFAGVDRSYVLKKEDIVSLPPDVGNLLVKKGKAQAII